MIVMGGQALSFNNNFLVILASDVVTLQIKQVFKSIVEVISYRDYLSIYTEW
jgi:hypothetical protein